MSSLDLSRLEDLIVSKDSLVREDVAAADIKARAVELLERMRNDAEEQLQLLALQGMKEGDIFHNFRLDLSKAHESDPGLYDMARYNTVVRLRGSSLALDWVRYSFYKIDGGGSRVFSKYVTKGAGFSYPMQRFSKAGKEEIDYIKIVEPRYAQIRKAAATLRKLRLAFSEYERDLEKIFK